MNNQNNNSSNNQINEINPSCKTIIFMMASSERAYTNKLGFADEVDVTKVKKTLINYSQEDNWDILEFIESKGYDDREALNQLISVVKSYKATNIPLTILFESRVVDLKACPIFPTILHILKLTKEIEIKVFYCGRSTSKDWCILEINPLSHYLPVINKKSLLEIAIDNLKHSINLASQGSITPYRKLFD